MLILRPLCKTVSAGVAVVYKLVSDYIAPIKHAVASRYGFLNISFKVPVFKEYIEHGLHDLFPSLIYDSTDNQCKYT